MSVYVVLPAVQKPLIRRHLCAVGSMKLASCVAAQQQQLRELQMRQSAQKAVPLKQQDGLNHEQE